MGKIQGDRENTLLDLTLAGESKRVKSSDTLPGTLARYAKAHDKALSTADYIRTHTKFNSFVQDKAFTGKALQLQNCGSFLNFRHYYTIDEIRLHKANFCKNHLLCPLCAIRRAAIMSAKYLERLAIIREENPRAEPYLVTVTVKDGPDLRERFLHLKHSFEKMTEQRKEAMRGRRNPIEMNKALGAVHTIEVKRGKNSEEWHPHNHGIWLCDERPLAMVLSKEWEVITGDSYIVDVRPFLKDQDELLAFVEVFSYNVKFSTMRNEDLIEAYKFLFGKRLINSFGLFRGVKIPEALEDEPIEGLPFVELFFQYVAGSGYSFIPQEK